MRIVAKFAQRAPGSLLFIVRQNIIPDDLSFLFFLTGRSYREIIDFLRRQYAGFTSVTALQRFAATLKKLVEYRAEINEQTNRAIQMRESAKLDKELLSDRLEIVQRLKDILEEQIGTGNVDDMMHTFAENSQYTLNVRKRKILTNFKAFLRPCPTLNNLFDNFFRTSDSNVK